MVFHIKMLVLVFNLALNARVSFGQSDAIEQIGSVNPSTSGLDVDGTIFLIDDSFKRDGLIFAFSAYMRANSPMKLQIWRPLTSVLNEKSFKLLSEYQIIPLVDDAREDIYISNLLQNCTTVQPNDRLGVYVEKSPSPIAYTFDATATTKLSRTVSSPVQTGETITFDQLIFPYVFSVAAYIYHGMDVAGLDFMTCPRDLLIPARYDPVTTTTSNDDISTDATTTDVFTTSSTPTSPDIKIIILSVVIVTIILVAVIAIAVLYRRRRMSRKLSITDESTTLKGMSH